MTDVLRKLQMDEGLKCNLPGDPWMVGGGGQLEEVERDR